MFLFSFIGSAKFSFLRNLGKYVQPSGNMNYVKLLLDQMIFFGYMVLKPVAPHIQKCPSD